MNLGKTIWLAIIFGSVACQSDTPSNPEIYEKASLTTELLSEKLGLSENQTKMVLEAAIVHSIASEDLRMDRKLPPKERQTAFEKIDNTFDSSMAVILSKGQWDVYAQYQSERKTKSPTRIKEKLRN